MRTLMPPTTCGAVMMVVALGACAPTMVKPGVSQAEANSDSFGCKMVARGAAPGGSYAEGKVGFVIAATALNALATAADRSSIYSDCMEARGYMPATNAANVAAPLPSTPTPVALTEPQSPPTPIPAVASISSNPASPAPAAAVPSPAPDGRVVLFPVTIYNSYHPHWTVGGQ